MKLLYLDDDAPAYYPIGVYFTPRNWMYIRKTADKVMETFNFRNSITLIGRGNSGAIIAGALAALLYQENYCVDIFISRKSQESSHGLNLDGLGSEAFKESRIIVIDDFMETGNTILAILEDLRKKFRREVPIDMLCIGNYLDYSSFKKSGGERYWDNWKKISENFEYIVCNNPEYRCRL